jgi:preprotein translocase SecE subunit
MARDRKRSKQRPRQRRAPQPARVPGDPREPRRDQRDPDAAPDPLAESSAEVEIAELAEAGALTDPRDDPEGLKAPLTDDDYPHPDELDPASDEPGRLAADDVVEEGEPDGGAAPARRREPAGTELTKDGNRFANFLRACIAELRRVQWPDRRQVTQATAVVLGFVVIAGSYLGLLDAVFSRLVNAIL